MVGGQRAGGRAAEGPLWAAGGALGALEGTGRRASCIFVDYALPAHAVGCSMRVSCSANFLLHEGMYVMGVARCLFWSTGPPNSGLAGRALSMLLVADVGKTSSR